MDLGNSDKEQKTKPDLMTFSAGILLARIVAMNRTADYLMVLF